jgi:Tfp pilus assembly protein PilF
VTSNHSNCTPSDPHVAASFINIGAVYAGKGDLENALVQYQKGLEIQTRVFGSDHPDVATSYQNLAVVYQRQGNHVQTKEMVTKAYHIFLRMLGPDHPQTQGLKPFVDE